MVRGDYMFTGAEYIETRAAIFDSLGGRVPLKPHSGGSASRRIVSRLKYSSLSGKGSNIGKSATGWDLARIQFSTSSYSIAPLLGNGNLLDK